METYWSFQERFSSPDRAERLAAIDQDGPFWQARDAVAERIEAGGSTAVDMILLLLESAETDNQVACVAAGPCEDLWAAEPTTFLDLLLPRLRREDAIGLAGRLMITHEELGRILAKIHSL